MRSDVQERPFQDSATVVAGDSAEVDPTAVQPVTDVQETPTRLDAGAACRDHTRPFHLSTKASRPYRPVAVHASAAEHDTPSRLIAPRNELMVAEDHFEPSHVRENGAYALLASDVMAIPTAMQNLVEGHDTLHSWGSTVRGGFGTGFEVHLDPFQISESRDRPSLESPTATQSLAAGHDTTG